VRLELLSFLPLSSIVAAVETPEGWRLTDGHRFSAPYAHLDAAIDDREAFRALTFGESLPGAVAP
jgi:hypothetical protein